MNKDTPIFSQWKEIKSNFKKEILFYRMGDFYELFYDDAEKGARLLDLTLTKKKNKEINVPMAGVPYHAAESYIKKLLKLGESVVIVEQVGELRKNQPMDRRVERILTPGTLVEESFLSERKENNLVSLYFCPEKNNVGISSIEISTGRFLIHEVDFSQLDSYLSLYNPSEIVLLSKQNNLLKNKKVNYINMDLNFVQAELLLKEQFNTHSLKSFSFEKMENAYISASIGILYLKEKYKSNLNFLDKLEVIDSEEYLHIDKSSRNSLEVNSTINGNFDNSLISIFSGTSSTMGFRNLKRWINKPLRNDILINNRLDAIDELKNDNKLTELLSELFDIERVLGRISLLSARPRDLIKLKTFLNLIPSIREFLQTKKSFFLSEILDSLIDFDEIKDLIDRAILDEPSLFIRDGNVIKDSYDERLDELRMIMSNTSQYLIDIEEREKINTNIEKLKVCHNKISGFFIEIPKNKAINIPSHYTRKQTLKNNERFTTEEITLLDEKITNAKIKSLNYEKKLYEEILFVISKHIPLLKRMVQKICDLDSINTLAKVARTNSFVRPVIGKKFNIVDGRHIVVEKNIKKFQPNSLVLNEESKAICITGPNMGGKSTFMRQNAIIALLAHVGSFVPASYCEVPLLDKIITRIGASDSISEGLSTFMMEMTETANIINNSTKKSLVILDEIGRGTSTYDGLSIAWATLKKMAEDIKCFTLFSTHYHEITEMAKTSKGLENYYLDVDFFCDNLIFTHKVKKGVASKSYGIEVAKMAGVDDDVIKNAKIKLNSLEAEYSKNTIQNLISNINIDNLSPKNALDLLYEIKENL